MAELGANVQEAAVGPSNIPVSRHSDLFIVLESPWGEVNRVIKCTSFSRFTKLFGGLNLVLGSAANPGSGVIGADDDDTTWGTEVSTRVTDGYYAVRSYFEDKANGPGIAHIVRVTATATAASRTFTDGATATTIVSRWPGVPGNDVEVNITGTGTSRLFQFRHVQADIYETYTVSTAEDAAKIGAVSQLVTSVVMGGALANTLPTATDSWDKLGGTTGTSSAGTADTYAATTTEYVGQRAATGVLTGLFCFADRRYGTGFLICPGGVDDGTTRTALEAHASTWRRTLIVGSVAGLNVTTAATLPTNIAGNNTAYYWPRIWVRSDSPTQPDGRILVSAAGAMAGLHARLDGKFNGPHKSAAGVSYRLYSAANVERASSGQELTDDEGSETLADSFVNTLRIKNGVVVSYGLRTTSTDERYRQIPFARVTQLMWHSVYHTAERWAFSVIDSEGDLYAEIQGTLGGFCRRLHRDGLFYGDPPGADPLPTDAYGVVCNDTNNTPETLAAGELRIDVGFTPAPNAEQVRLTLNPRTVLYATQAAA
jgi:hypothetical protein